jgi:SHS2 domain-containing protein
MNKDFELLPHTADLKIRVYGTSLADLFAHAVIGMFQSIEPRTDACKKINDRLVCDTLPKQHDVNLTAPDRESLLVNFLSYLLYLSDVHNEAYLNATIHEIDEHHIKAIVHGVPIQGFDMAEIKAVTYNDLVIQQKNGMWHADIVFDI